VEDLIDASKIIAGKLPMETVTVDLVDVVTQAVEAMHPRAAEKELELHTQLDIEAGAFWATECAWSRSSPICC
jgi:signal transduction histidine kinase